MSATGPFPQTQTNKIQNPVFRPGFFLTIFQPMKILFTFFICSFTGFLHSQTFDIHPADSSSQTIRIDENGNPVDTTIRKNTAEEKAAIKTAFDSMHCNCSKSAGDTIRFQEDGILVLFNQGKISKKGCFIHYKLVCGIECVYDQNGNLTLIKKVENFKVTEEIHFPN